MITDIFCINTSEIPSELSRENFTSSHLKIECYLHTWRDHRRYGYIINRAFESRLIWYFTGAYIINRILHTRLWIWILSSRVQLDISRISAATLMRYRVHHPKLKFVYTRGHVISSISANVVSAVETQPIIAREKHLSSLWFFPVSVVFSVLLGSYWTDWKSWTTWGSRC